MVSSIGLLKTKRFLPLFLTQFFGALNDNIFKNVIVISVTYAASVGSNNTQILVTVVALSFILPFFLFSALAGQLADKYDRAKVARVIKIVELIIVMMLILAYNFQNVPLLLFSLFLMGSQSTFFGPVKYAIIPQLMPEREVLAANGLISGATFFAILVGTIVGGMLVVSNSTEYAIAFITLIAAILGCVSSYFIPSQQPSAQINVRYNIFTQTLKIINMARKNREVFLTIIAISWFWLLGATFFAQLPNYVSGILSAGNYVITFFLTVFAVAIAIGSFICNKLLNGKISAVFAPISLLLVSIFTFDLCFASAPFQVHSSIPPNSLEVFIASSGSYRVVVDLFFIAMFCGVYVVPLYSLIQASTTNSSRSRIIAALNIYNSCFMVIAAIFAIIMLSFGLTVINIFFLTAIANLAMILLVVKIIPSPSEASLPRKVFAFLNKS